jgi:hypothetical protein
MSGTSGNAEIMRPLDPRGGFCGFATAAETQEVEKHSAPQRGIQSEREERRLMVLYRTVSVLHLHQPAFSAWERSMGARGRCNGGIRFDGACQ